jgi:hypothetical protein
VARSFERLFSELKRSEVRERSPRNARTCDERTCMMLETRELSRNAHRGMPAQPGCGARACEHAWLLRVDMWHHSHARYRNSLFQTHAPHFFGTPCIPVISIAWAVPCLAFGTAVFGFIKVTNRRNEDSREFGRRENVPLAIDTPCSVRAAVVQATQAHRRRMTRTNDVDELWCALLAIFCHCRCSSITR